MEKTWWDRVITFNKKHNKDTSNSGLAFITILEVFGFKVPPIWMQQINQMDEKDLLKLILILNIESHIKQNKIMINEQDFLAVLGRIDNATTAVAAELKSQSDAIKAALADKGSLNSTEAQDLMTKMNATADKLEAIGKPEAPAGAGDTPVTNTDGTPVTSTTTGGEDTTQG